MHIGRSWGHGQRVLLSALVVMLLSGPFSPLRAQQAGTDADLVDCGSTFSLEKRLLMQQWSAPGQCAQPVRTRVTDRFLGFTCVERGTEAAVCRSYLPVADSRAYDSAQFFRCVDLGLTGSDDGVAINRIREWTAPRDRCNWDPGAGVLALEVDFDRSLVCVATLCMPVDRLSVIGKLRLKHLLESAFRDLDLTAQAKGPQAVRPVRTEAR
jgi:hypothetical protein